MRVDRRQTLQLLAGAALLPLVGCGADGTREQASQGGSCEEIPEEIWSFVEAPPSTELGEQEAAWAARRAGSAS